MFLNKAKHGILAQDIEQKTIFINKTMAIVDELQGCLDFSQGGEIARNLDRIYDYFQRQLMMIIRTGDVKAIDHICTLVEEIRSAWKSVAAANQSQVSVNQGVMVTG